MKKHNFTNILKIARIFICVALAAGLGLVARAQISTRSERDVPVGVIGKGEQPRVNYIPGDQIDSVIRSTVADRNSREIVRVISDGQFIDSFWLAEGVDRQYGTFEPESKSVTVRGTLAGQDVTEHIRFFTDGDEVYVVRDVYLGGQARDLAIGLGTPVLLESTGDITTLADNSVAGMSVFKFSGYTNDTGIVDGKVQMDIGKTYNGQWVLNDRRGVTTITITGSGFGSATGTVQLAGRSVPILKWSDTSVRIDPTMEWNASPICAVLKMKRPDGTYITWGMSFVPAIQTRVYGQCTHRVAFLRKTMGMTPSPTAYDGYSSMTTSYVPRVGDQLRWDRRHTAIITGVSGPVYGSDGTRTWNLTVSEQNADGKNSLRTYSTSFQTKTSSGTTKITLYPKSSVTSFGGTSYYYPPTY